MQACVPLQSEVVSPHEQIARAYGKVDILVSNAGTYALAPSETVTGQEFRQTKHHRSHILLSRSRPAVLVPPACPATAPFEAGYFPLPVSAIFCTLLRAESLIDKVPVRVPVCVGEKVTLIVQLFPTVSLAGQSLVSE